MSFDAAYRVLYDQAGLTVHQCAENWDKTSFEFSDGATRFSAVLTRDGHSDGTVVEGSELKNPRQIKLSRSGDSKAIHYRIETGWQ